MVGVEPWTRGDRPEKAGNPHLGMGRFPVVGIAFFYSMISREWV